MSNELESVAKYPEYAAKTDAMTDIAKAMSETGGAARGRLLSILARLSNTDTNDWTSGATDRHPGV